MLTDTSAWVEYLRRTGSVAAITLREALVAGRDDVLIPELVVMELSMGPTDEAEARRLRSMLHGFGVVPLAPSVDSARAAVLFRAARRAGSTVRSGVDCLIAAMALRLEVPLLHRDRDFEVLARHCGLQTVAGLD